MVTLRSPRGFTHYRLKEKTLPDFRRSVPADSAQLAAVRHSVSAWLETEGVADPARADVVLATHEATANAVEHSSSETPVVIVGRIERGMIAIEVSDEGSWRPPELNEERGRGLLMIASLVSKVSVQNDSSGTTVRLLHPAQI